MIHQKQGKELLSWLLTIAAAVLIVIAVRSFFLGNYIVDGPSMMPTLHNGDRLIVTKMSYRWAQIKRFDVVIFHATAKDDYVKRVIGLPGDTICYRRDQLYINNRPVSEPFLNTLKKESRSGMLTWDFTLKSLTGVTRVPEGKLWVMGDNRRNSFDSRLLPGHFISESKVIGKVDLRYWPWRSFGLIHGN